MKNEAKANEESDNKEKEKIDKLDQADMLIFQSEKNIKDYGEKISESDKTDLNEFMNKLKEAHKSQNISDMDKYSKELNEKWNAVSTQMYQNSSTQNTGNPNQSGESQESKKGPEPDITDVDFEEVK